MPIPQIDGKRTFALSNEPRQRLSADFGLARPGYFLYFNKAGGQVAFANKGCNSL